MGLILDFGAEAAVEHAYAEESVWNKTRPRPVTWWQQRLKRSGNECRLIKKARMVTRKYEHILCKKKLISRHYSNSLVSEAVHVG
jgi:hypothetical protein